MRKRIALCVSILVFSLLVLRIFHVMVISGSWLRADADNNRFFHKDIFPARGIIFDRNKVPLVENVQFYRKYIDDPFSVNPRSVPVDEHEALDLLIEKPEILARIQQRYYPFGQTLSHLVGYVGFGTAGELTSNAKVGKTGLEKTLQPQLSGEKGEEEYEINALGKITRLVHTQQPNPAKDISISINSSLSQKAAQLLVDRMGVVIVSDIETSQVLTMVSTPGFDPMDISPSLNDSATPLLNRALQVYPPGSVFKMMVALAALRQGSIKNDTLVLDEGELKIGDATFRNWYFSSYGRTEGEINVAKALSRSNDVFFYKIAAQVGPDSIAQMAKLFHLGEPTGIELPGEQTGLMPTPMWKEKNVGEKWYLGDTYHMGIGQGDVLVSPLQINAMTAAIARRGVWCRPTLFFQVPECEDLGLSKNDLETVIEGMVGACSPGGTAFPFFQYNAAASDNEKIACKTGTAEHGARDAKGNRATHAWFTMFYPSIQPKVAITVLLESQNGTQFLEGSADAAPIAKSIWESWKSTR